MKTRGQFIPRGTRIINGERLRIAEHKLTPYYRIGTANIPATSLDDAINKYLIWKERHSEQPPLLPIR